MPRKATRKGLLRDFSPRVGYAYDLRMQYHCDLDDTDDPHPEDPRRTYWIHNLLERSDLLNLMHAVKIFPATDTQILRVHRNHYINSLEKTKVMERASLIDEQNKYDSVYLCSESYYCAKLSAGGLLSLCHEVVSGRLDSGFAIVRPPGHHACKSRAMGFCLLNNIAIAIEDILLNGLAERIMVVDWDIHHGNGIQDIFIRNPNVLYCSLHRYDGGDFYPASNEGNMDKVGKDAGRGFNINIPWVTSGMGDGDYLYAFNQLIIPVAKQFSPDFIIIASGFDAAICDPIGECDVSPECYATMTHMLNEINNGKIVLSLEGGYNLDAIANSALGCVKALLGIKWRAGFIPEQAIYNAYATLSAAEINGVSIGPQVYRDEWKADGGWDPKIEVPECFNAGPSVLGKEVVDEVVRIQKQYWKCL